MKSCFSLQPEVQLSGLEFGRRAFEIENVDDVPNFEKQALPEFGFGFVQRCFCLGPLSIGQHNISCMFSQDASSQYNMVDLSTPFERLKMC